ncbi:MAG: hypothetical protein CBE07_001465 [Pelagibacteraceae bacterium TMED247]|nr:MAG: hypothetical protein CBE07_001465 [Pelagibacteraceae bacterium TMED247]
MNYFSENENYITSALRPFGPTIMKFRLPELLISDFNKSCDEIIKNKELAQSLDFSENLVGKVKQELLIPEEVMDKHITYFYKALGNYYRFLVQNELAKKTSSINTEVKSAWFVRSFAGDFNPGHIHNNCNMTCVGYLKLPEWQEEQRRDSEDHHPSVGHLDFIQGPCAPLQRHNHSVLPKVGDFYLFPAHLIHTVYPFRSDGERRSFSINFNLSE